jgi:hypothetical protein
MILNIWGRSKHLITIQTRLLHVLAEHVYQRVGLRHRSHLLKIQRVDIGEVIQHFRQLLGGDFNLRRGQIKAGQARHLGNYVDINTFRHDDTLLLCAGAATGPHQIHRRSHNCSERCPLVEP